MLGRNGTLNCREKEEMKNVILICAVASSLLACASSGPIPTGDGAYLLTKQSAGGVFKPGASVKADLLIEANEFCGKSGKQIQLLSANSKNAIPFARTSSAEIQFKCT